MGARGLSRRAAGALIGAGLLAPSLGLADAPDPEFQDLTTGTDDEARLTTPVTINGEGPYRFVVDTGSNHSIIAEDLAQALKLPSVPSVLVNTVSGAEQTPAVRVDTLAMGRRDGRPVIMGVAPRSAIGGAGLLGIDQLDNLRLTLNFKEKRLAVGRSGRRGVDSNALAVHAVQKSGQLTLVGAEVGGMPVTAFVDSGSQVTIGNLALRQAIGAQLKPLNGSTATGEVPVIGATGLETLGETGFLPPLRLGGLRVSRLAVVFADLHTFHVWGMAKEPALLIGVDLLRRFDTVDLDFGRSEVLFRLAGYDVPTTGSRLPGGSRERIRTYMMGGG